MPEPLGAHNPRVDLTRALLTKKGRCEQRQFSFEGPTLLQCAREARIALDAIYATQRAYESYQAVRDYEALGTPVFAIDERTAKRISGVETPTGLVAVAPIRLTPLEAIFERPGTVLLLADVSDPGNAGTLLRTAQAFGVERAVLGDAGVEPYHPKLVRAAMGALFRAEVAQASPEALRARLGDWTVTGLEAEGAPLRDLSWPQRSLLVVGGERGGLGRWKPLCDRIAGIPMRGPGAESLNAAAAGAIALYEATEGTAG